MLLLAPDACRCGRSDICFSNDGRLSVEGLVSNDGLLPELLMGLEKFEKLGFGLGSCCDPLMEYSDVIEGDLCTGCIQGEKGDCGLETPLLPENLRDEDMACEPLVDCPSSSPLSGGTDRMLWKLRGDFGYRGDCGGARPRSEVRERCDLCEPFVMVLGCVEIVSMLFVKLGKAFGEGACTLTILGSTGSGEEALGMSK